MNEMMKSEQFLEKAAAVDKAEHIVGMNLQKKQAGGRPLRLRTGLVVWGLPSESRLIRWSGWMERRNRHFGRLTFESANWLEFRFI